MSKHIASSAELESILKAAGDKLVVIDFTASWCGPCKAISPTFEALAKEHAQTAHFLKVDVDEQAAIAQRYGVRAMPTFTFLRKGGVLETLRGANPSRLTQLTKQYIAGGSASTFPGAGQSIAGGTHGSTATRGTFGQVPIESLLPFLLIFGYTAYVLYGIYKT